MVSPCDCTDLWHMAVDELHPTENKEDVVVQKELTGFLGGVNRYSFFDSSEVYAVGGESGAQASSLHPIPVEVCRCLGTSVSRYEERRFLPNQR